jgi:hypothetical protein
MCAATESIVAVRIQGECPIEEYPDLVGLSCQCAVKNVDTINPIAEGAV